VRDCLRPVASVPVINIRRRCDDQPAP
jgi:hypothetical protein